MKAISRAMTMTFSAGMFVTMFTSTASAGCGDLSSLQGPFVFAQPSASVRSSPASVDAARAVAGGSSGASFIGMWYFQLVSQGNVTHVPTIPDGAIIDFGYNQVHGDGTELINSGGHAPATENFCMGVWGQTGFLTYEVNHFPLSYDAITGTLTNLINLREQVTLSPSGDSFTGTFTLNVYDTKGNQVDHVAGIILASRVTVDTVVSAVP